MRYRIRTEQRQVGGYIRPHRGLVIRKGKRLGLFSRVATSVRGAPFFDQGIVKRTGSRKGILGKDQFGARVTIVEYHRLCGNGLLPAQESLILRDTEQLRLFIVGDRDNLLMLPGIPAVVFSDPGTSDGIRAATVRAGSLRKGNLWCWIAIIGGDQRRRIGDIFARDADISWRAAKRRSFRIPDGENLGCGNGIATSIPCRPGSGDRLITRAGSRCGRFGKGKEGIGVTVVGNCDDRSGGYSSTAQRHISRDTDHHRGRLILDGYRLGTAGRIATSISTCPGAHQGKTGRTGAGEGILPIREEGAGIAVITQGQRCRGGDLVATHCFIGRKS